MKEVSLKNEEHLKSQIMTKWLRSRDVRKMLGISDSTLQNMRISGAVPAYKLGSSWFYREDEMIAALANGRTKQGVIHMVSQNLNFIVYQLEKRVDSLEQIIESLNGEKDFEQQDWDDAMLQRRWNVCKRTTANYRKNGLDYYKRGGRIYYTPKQRSDFKKLKKQNATKADNNSD